MRGKKKLSPHLDIFRSTPPALFSISKRIFGVLFSSLVLGKVVSSLYLLELFVSDLYPDQYTAFHTKIFGAPNVKLFVPEWTSQYLLALEEPCWLFGTVGSFHYALDVALITCATFYVVSFLAFTEDMRLRSYYGTILPVPAALLVLSMLTYFALKMWL